MVALDTESRPVARAPGTRRRGSRTPASWVRRGGLTTLIFFVPLLLSFSYFSWWPILRSVVLSLQQTNFIVTEWVGLANFQRVLADPLLATAVWNTTYFTLLALLIGFPVPILMAVVVAEMRRTRGLASVLAYLPVIIPPVVAVLLWKTFYRPDEAGLFNTVLGWFGLGPFQWLNDPSMVIPAIVVQATWASFGTAVIIYLATLMTIRTELYEAAEIDGAKILRRFWHVTLPQMRGILLIMLLLQVIGTFQVFTEPYIMTGGGPENHSVTILMLIYRYAFISGDYGRATALSLILAVALSALSAIYLWATRRWSTS
ncbi:binding-protein-dependent transport systems inner membrane component [Beutenbergia cavernae DSM 12333]|uniref:Binding-protein-dependent transport systems inner membrane component n=1 Tax=Beutenbergia cavernae (strain ATCC BAA-8 / DSM 12333 / CCUG 43141 / JCM 11478 / NBRC 16432 / NCIMB 13614 / HKI 0122) TaxID=471853 RepID=C5BZK0_BEUC1|nr:sugar ABC transporter permease [Beutenbergia cavernae]ACQ79172.1 binding-protein-dependent transport systems inner membrane component [Beutenbergia cavernae DSM 12333]